MRKLNQVILVLYGFILIISCQAHKQVQTNPKEKVKYQKLAAEKFGDNYFFEFNKSRTHLICITGKSERKYPERSLSFFIYDLEKDKILLEDFITYGNIKWKNNYQIEVNKIPGVVKKNEEENTVGSYIYDVKKEKKLPISNKKELMDNTL